MKYLREEDKKELLLGAATEITNRYYELASDLVTVVCEIKSQVVFFLSYVNDVLHNVSKFVIRQGKQNLHCREYDRVHKDEQEQAQIPLITTFLTLIRSACNYFLIFRYYS